MLKNYTSLKAELDAKTRGRKHEAKISTAPEMWASISDYPESIVVYYESGGHVATLMPDNSMRIMFGGWHTQTTTKIIYELSGQTAWLRDNHIWFCGYPTDGGVLYFGPDRRYIKPKKFFDLSGHAYAQLQKVTRDSLPPKVRLLLEMGEVNDTPRISQRVKDYAVGKVALDTLSPRDVITCMNAQSEIVSRLMGEAV